MYVCPTDGGLELDGTNWSQRLRWTRPIGRGSTRVTDWQACLGLTTALTGHTKTQCLILRIKHSSYYICGARPTTTRTEPINRSGPVQSKIGLSLRPVQTEVTHPYYVPKVALLRSPPSYELHTLHPIITKRKIDESTKKKK